MFFTKVGRVIAWLLVVAGGLRAALGFAVAFSGNQALAPFYLGTDTSGEAINRGLLVLLIGVSVGMVAEISRSLAAKSEANGQKPS